MSYLDVTKWSRKTEFIVVVGAAFGWFSVSSVWSLIAPPAGDETLAANEGWTALLVYEGILLVALGWLLHRRGWNWARVGLAPSWRDTATSLLLMAIVYAAVVVVFYTVWGLLGSTSQVSESPGPATPPIDLPIVFAVSAMNGLFEELFLCGYLITVTKETRGFWPAVNASTGLRLLCHLYQGTYALISILPLGLIFGYWYAKTGRLWPLIVAHAMFDLLALLTIGR